MFGYKQILFLANWNAQQARKLPFSYTRCDLTNTPKKSYVRKKMLSAKLLSLSLNFEKRALNIEHRSWVEHI